MNAFNDAEIHNPWQFVENVEPPTSGSNFIVWDEILGREIKTIYWCAKINDFASGEVEWSGSFLFWRKDDSLIAESPYTY